MTALAGIAAHVAVALTAVTVAGCSWSSPGDPAPRPPSPTRPAATDACTIVPRPDLVVGLPLADAETARIAADVVGEKVTWQATGRRVTAWVGIDAPDAFEDLDFVEIPRPPGQPREWTTRLQPQLFLAATATGHRKPCDQLYVSTEGLPGDTARKVLGDLTVRMGPGDELPDR
jgi:hypothetical protein